MLVHGPISSRRLGFHLAIHNFPEKVCTYSCVYCQGGHTKQLDYERSQFFKPLEIVKEVRLNIAKCKERGEVLDYLAYIPDGEPTQDVNLGVQLDHLKKFGIKLAVMTNSSLIWREDVQSDLMKADWVSIKIDTIDDKIWRSINRPHKSSRLSTIINGIIEFAQIYEGELVTETMIVDGMNSSARVMEETSGFISKLKPSMSYLSIPTKPPTESEVALPSAEIINECFQVFSRNLSNVEYLIGYEFAEVSILGNVEDDLLAVLSKRSMSEEKAKAFIVKNKGDFSVLKKLLSNELISEVTWNGEKYYLRKPKMEEDRFK